MENVTLNVKGMSCGHCVKAVEGSVGALAGVEQVDVNLEAGKVNVAYNDQKVSLSQIKEAIDDQGYDVE
ncbi:copper chaperone CopZ [Ureibacillus chungkukjangi]|uniref:Copper chaperone CopZ n=1 Tax=Ureibacillus chungkukjangi TaxID=1202712 RepID=A0A318TWX0_9BACL|nr:copper chaperone CopZ [Ureibacillus chungkukjangi]MCM3388903.1 copper chaperone CopZ [Ureibacillus chungkukjangi]PYF08247.1 copper chaperone [Ureibacillus chungkukjangi]